VDSGNPGVKVSRRWRIWRVNEEFQYVGKLGRAQQGFHIGIVVAPIDLIDRIRTGVTIRLSGMPIVAWQEASGF
jgi:hypothetical protein